MTIGNRPDPRPSVRACSSCYAVRPVALLFEVRDRWARNPPRWACRPDAPIVARGDCLARVRGTTDRYRLHDATTGEAIARRVMP